MNEGGIVSGSEDIDGLYEICSKPEAKWDDFFRLSQARIRKQLRGPELTTEQIHEMVEADKRERYLEDGVFDIDDITSDENILKKWYEFGCQTQDSYPEYHFASMLVIIGHLFPAEMKPQYAPKGVHNNMWGIVLGNSGCGKTVACGAATAIMSDDRIAPYACRISNKFTPESMTVSLAENRRRFHYSNEAAGFLKFMRRDYASELSDDLTNAYDGERVSKQTIKAGPIFCNDPLFSGLWNTTIDSWSKFATPEQFASGMFFRPFFIISTREKEVKRDEPITKELEDMKNGVIDEIFELCKLVAGRTIVFSESDSINDWKHELRVESQTKIYSEMERSALQRVFDQARKVAMNLTIASKEFHDYLKNETFSGNFPIELREITYKIPEKYAILACDIAEFVFWKNSTKALKLTYGSGQIGKVMKVLENGELSRTDIGDMVHKYGKQLTDFIGDLPVIEVKRMTPGSKKPTLFYKLA